MEQIAIFCDTDDFCKAYEEYCRNKLLMDKEEVVPRTRMSLSEIMTILIMYHLSGYKTFKWYYTKHVIVHQRKDFPNIVSYNRFVEIMKFALVPLILYTIKARSGKCSGISFVDSTPLKVCDNHRIHSHRVFSEYAKTGKSSMGWFYGFKLHLIINDEGEILSFCLTSGNVDDRNEAVMDSLTKEIFGKLFADRGYISQKLFEKLLKKDITLVTRAKKNMKNKLMDLYDSLMLRKRAVIESVNDFLKNICDIEHSRHRSVTNFIVNLISALAAYSFLPKKPSVCSDCNIQEGFLCLLD
ncbi:MAG: IS982 family transposase [Ruminococcus sp.]|nr:IS982 family transposase [Ruminococcus sp.]